MSHKSQMLMLTLLLIATGGFSSAQKLHLKVKPVTVPGAQSADIVGINDEGVMVGIYTDGSGASHGLMLNGDTVTNIDDPKGVNGTTVCWGINNLNNGSGDIVGWYTSASGDTQGFLYNNKKKTFQDITPPKARQYSNALYINDSEMITGGYADSAGIEHGYVFNAKAGKYKVYNVPNEAQSEARGIDSTGKHIVVVGYDASGNNYTSWLYCQGSGCKKRWSQIKVKGATGGAFAFGLNDALDIAGLFASSAEHSFLYHSENNKVYEFDPRNCLNSATFGINNKQTIVGFDCKGLFLATYSIK